VIGLLRRISSRTAALQVGRLRLVTITPEMLAAEQQRDLKFTELQRLLGARVTEEWPPEHWEPHVYDFILKQYADDPERWGRFPRPMAMRRLGTRRCRRFSGAGMRARRRRRWWSGCCGARVCGR
jgi:hypothetical protein